MVGKTLIFANVAAVPGGIRWCSVAATAAAFRRRAAAGLGECWWDATAGLGCALVHHRIGVG